MLAFFAANGLALLEEDAIAHADMFIAVITDGLPADELLAAMTIDGL